MIASPTWRPAFAAGLPVMTSAITTPGAPTA
jgi:hypothetical protein